MSVLHPMPWSPVNRCVALPVPPVAVRRLACGGGRASCPLASMGIGSGVFPVGVDGIVSCLSPKGCVLLARFSSVFVTSLAPWVVRRGRRLRRGASVNGRAGLLLLSSLRMHIAQILLGCREIGRMRWVGGCFGCLLSCPSLALWLSFCKISSAFPWRSLCPWEPFGYRVVCV